MAIFMKKKAWIIAAAVVLLLAVALGAVYLKPVSVEIGDSELYNESERQAAVDVGKEKFKELDGCKLFKLSYAGDEDSRKEFDYDDQYDEAIVINSVFLSPLTSRGAWEAHEIYTWHFILMRKDGGDWTLLTYGYA